MTFTVKRLAHIGDLSSEMNDELDVTKNVAGSAIKGVGAGIGNSS
jgi:hypothetical protein